MGNLCIEDPLLWKLTAFRVAFVTTNAYTVNKQINCSLQERVHHTNQLDRPTSSRQSSRLDVKVHLGPRSIRGAGEILYRHRPKTRVRQVASSLFSSR